MDSVKFFAVMVFIILLVFSTSYLLKVDSELKSKSYLRNITPNPTPIKREVYKYNNEVVNMIPEASNLVYELKFRSDIKYLARLFSEYSSGWFLDEKKFVKVKATAYTACKEECGKDWGKTYLGHKPIPFVTVGVSHDHKNWLGKKIYIKNVGVFHCTDLMNKRMKNKIDILFSSKKACREWGINDVEVYVM